MPRIIDYFFTVASPWTYLGHGLFRQIAAKHGAVVRYRPIPILEVFEATGSLPLPRRPPARQRYRFLEMQRWRDKRGLPLTLKPAHFPLDATLINSVIIALAAQGHDPAELTGHALSGVWAEEANFNDETVIAALITRIGLSAPDVLAQARSEPAAAILAQNGRDAVAADVFGAPCYVLDGEVFWGQDRLELLDDALTSGRKAYRPI
jgi:2-hydroxychromene-2-carboxylate isomerase